LNRPLLPFTAAAWFAALEGFEALFQVRDNSEAGAPDLMSPVLLTEAGSGTTCLFPAEFDLAVVKGKFRVRGEGLP
jgi:hypothetical protein